MTLSVNFKRLQANNRQQGSADGRLQSERNVLFSPQLTGVVGDYTERQNMHIHIDKQTTAGYNNKRRTAYQTLRQRTTLLKERKETEERDRRVSAA